MNQAPARHFRRSPRRRPRGWVLIAVLAVLAVLSALTAGFFVAAQDSGTLNRLAVARMVAAKNADFQLQEAIRQMRSRQIDLTPVVGICTDAQVEDGTCPGMFVSPLVDNGSSLRLTEGGGLQGQFFIYRRVAPGDIGVPPNRYVVRAVGYAGYTLNSPNLVSSIVEAEVDVGERTQFRCIGSYECQ
jgi:type II secretory pathway pseudopilin PulG